MGGAGSSGSDFQQQQLETQQAVTAAQLNNEENQQRKSILNAMQGTRVFRESALSRAVRGNTNGAAAATGAPSNAQTTTDTTPVITSPNNGIFTQLAPKNNTATRAATSATTAGGAGAGGGFGAVGGRGGAAGVGSIR